MDQGWTRGWIGDALGMDQGGQRDGSGIDQRWIGDGLGMDKGMDWGWIRDGLGDGSGMGLAGLPHSLPFGR